MVCLFAEPVRCHFQRGQVDSQQCPAFGTRVRAGCLVGMAQAEAKFVLLLGIDEVLATEEALDALAAEGTAPAAPVASARA